MSEKDILLSMRIVIELKVLNYINITISQNSIPYYINIQLIS